MQKNNLKSILSSNGLPLQIESKSETDKEKGKNSRHLRRDFNRVPDETLNLEDSVFNLDTSLVLGTFGILKVLGIILISVGSLKENDLNLHPSTTFTPDTVYTYDDKAIIIHKAVFGAGAADRATTIDMNFQTHNANVIRADSIAPICSSFMLGLSAAMDFFCIFKRRGNAVLLHMLASTIALVACILCIEYDRIKLTSITRNKVEDKMRLHYNLYLSVVIVASISFAICFFSIGVGMCLARLEQTRLNMERDGMGATLAKKQTKLPEFVRNIVQRLNCMKVSVITNPSDDDTITNSDSILERSKHVSWGGRKSITLSPDNASLDFETKTPDSNHPESV
ncbi:uncharacterized protein LOC143464934 isoform X2 [Clavelina lepadiformis]|uniref:uncharacterized protein LOC143464934 isoform X2 n=1 Tax=Clavelina lepadiformis TaxID=159417 RepID=UPI004042EC29